MNIEKLTIRLKNEPASDSKDALVHMLGKATDEKHDVRIENEQVRRELRVSIDHYLGSDDPKRTGEVDHPESTRGMLKELRASKELQEQKEKTRSLLRKALIAIGILGVGGLVMNEALKSNDVRKTISGMVGELRHGYEGVLNGDLEKEVQSAKNHEFLSPEEYHKKALFTPPADGTSGSEQPGKHWMRAHLVPGKEPRPIVFVIGGNTEYMYDPNPGDPPTMIHGSRQVFEQLAATNKCHVIQLRVGEELSRDPKVNNAVAMEHVKNIVADATFGRGMFKDVQCSEVRFFGYSYGAGVTQQLTAPGATVLPKNIKVGPTVFVDGIQFRSTPPVALDSAPSAAPHLHIWQESSHHTVGYAAGHGLRKPRAQDREINATNQIANAGHIRMTSAQHEDVRKVVYDPAVAFLAQGMPEKK